MIIKKVLEEVLQQAKYFDVDRNRVILWVQQI